MRKKNNIVKKKSDTDVLNDRNTADWYGQSKNPTAFFPATLSILSLVYFLLFPPFVGLHTVVTAAFFFVM